jgi:hypothetical protein
MRIRFYGSIFNVIEAIKNSKKIAIKKLTVDNFPKVTEFIDPTESELHETHLLFTDQKWHDVHKSGNWFTWFQ